MKKNSIEFSSFLFCFAQNLAIRKPKKSCFFTFLKINSPSGKMLFKNDILKRLLLVLHAIKVEGDHNLLH
jgi:hypothetical protein